MLKALLILLPIGAISVTISALINEEYLRLVLAALMMFAFVDVKRKIQAEEATEKEAEKEGEPLPKNGE